MEHERQRLAQRKAFDEQMRMLEQQQQQELLTIPVLDGSSGNSLQHFAVSAPTTPPRVDSALGDGEIAAANMVMNATLLSKAVGKAEKRKSVTYAPGSGGSDYEAPVPMGLSGSVAQPSLNRQSSFRSSGFAKSMPASRRTSTSSHDEDLASQLQGLSVIDSGFESPISAGVQSLSRGRSADTLDSEAAHFVANGNGNGYNAGMLLDQQLENEMNSTYIFFICAVFVRLVAQTLLLFRIYKTRSGISPSRTTKSTTCRRTSCLRRCVFTSADASPPLMDACSSPPPPLPLILHPSRRPLRVGLS